MFCVSNVNAPVSAVKAPTPISAAANSPVPIDCTAAKNAGFATAAVSCSMDTRRFSDPGPDNSNRSPKAFCNDASAPPSVSRAASADPPNCFSNSARITVCAPIISLAATISLTISFCASVKVIPDRPSAVIPKTGSFSALPTCSAAELRSVPMAVARSSVALVASSNWSPLICVNVSNTPCMALVASSPKFVTF